MDFHLKQWKAQQQQESDTTNHHHFPCAKIPKLALIETTTPDNLHHSNSTLPLFVPEEASPAPSSASSRFQRMGSSSSSSSNFSWVQWQELELQALIYRYMIAGAAVPPELLQPIKKSLLHSPYFLHYSGQYQPPAALMHPGYWGRGSMDPEPGRCRRTDGKKWRCSRDVVGGQKYCERHMHRGRNRSRKPVELPAASSLGGATSASPAHLQAPAAAVSGGGGGGGGGTHFALSGSSPQSIDLFQSYSSEEPKSESKGGLFGPHGGADDRSDSRVLRHFFDDWPRSIHDSDNGTPSSTSLSISMPGNNNASSSDVSLKLSTGIGDEPRNPEQQQQQQQIGNWGPSGWGPNQVASMGGPLAEALRSSSATAHSSPTSVLHRGSRASEASFVTA